jgi:hypothetical protein
MNTLIVYTIVYKVSATEETGLGECLDKLRELGEAEVIKVELEEVKSK